MANVAERWGLIPDLRTFCAEARPVWGTCAGMIFLADRATGVSVHSLCALQQNTTGQPRNRGTPHAIRQAASNNRQGPICSAPISVKEPYLLILKH